MSSVLELAASVVIGYFIGSVADNIVGLVSLYGLTKQWTGSAVDIVGLLVGSALLVGGSLIVKGFTVFLPISLVWMGFAAFMNMPTYIGMIKEAANWLATPINKEVTELAT